MKQDLIYHVISKKDSHTILGDAYQQMIQVDCTPLKCLNILLHFYYISVTITSR